MNDPHVKALIYDISHEESVSYRDAQPIECEREAFLIRIDNNKVRFKLKGHFATIEDARNAIEPFIRNWEFDAGLRGKPGHFQLKFDKPEVIDRCPTPGVTDISVSITLGSIEARVRVVNDKQYPPPPSDVTLNPEDPDFSTMYNRLQGYFKAKEPLPSMAYFCLNIPESTSTPKEHRSSKPRKEAAKRYGIDLAVLNKIGDLTANKGGEVARKATGTEHELTTSERRFIEDAVKVMIRRRAEVAYDPSRVLRKISFSDLHGLD